MCGMAKFSDFNEDELRRKIENSPGFQQMQEDANQHIRQVIREVNASHRLRPATEVEAEIRRRFADDGITPNEENLPRIVREISDGTLTDNG